MFLYGVKENSSNFNFHFLSLNFVYFQIFFTNDLIDCLFLKSFKTHAVRALSHLNFISDEALLLGFQILHMTTDV